MATTSYVLSVGALLCVFAGIVAGEGCLSPEVKSDVYTSTEAPMSTLAVFIVEFSLKCKNGLKDIPLYAELDGRVMPASRAIGSQKYQVSWTADHKARSSGRYSVRLFDEDGYAAFRKAQRNGEDTSKIAHLYEVPINHPGVWRGPLVSSELVAVCVMVLVWYSAYSARARLQS